MIDSCKPITKLNSKKYPHFMIFFDTESYIIDENENHIYIPKNKQTENERHILRLGVAIYVETNTQNNVIKREVYYFKTADEFWNFVESKTNKSRVLYIYAHNAKYDTLNVNVNEQLERLKYDVPFPTINNAFIISATKNRKKIKIIDTFNYVRTSVEKMGEQVGHKKIELGEKGSIDFNKIDDKTLYPYCENDVVVIEKFILNLIQFLYKNNLGSLKYTTASTALDIYRHSFIDYPIYYHTNDNILKQERSAYRGGIVECFHLKKLPKQKYYLLDINSMYVSVMANKSLPTYPILHINSETIQISDLAFSIKNNYVVADVLISTKSNNGKYGIKHDKKLIFPIGNYRVTLHQSELENALKENIIKKVYSYTIYKSFKCLSSYAIFFSEQKKKATNKVDYELSKLFGNGLYGKFGMRKYLTDIVDPVLLLGDKIENIIRKNSKKQFKKEHLYPPSVPTNNGNYIYWRGQYVNQSTDDFIHVPRTNVALAGAVTAYARTLLSKYIEIAGKNHIFYSDTDSLLVDETGFKKLKNYIDDKELGYLKIEFTFNSGKINAPKNYIFVSKQNMHINSITQINSKKRLLKIPFKLNHLQLEQKSIILKKRFRSKGIPFGATLEDGTYSFMRFTTFKEYLLTGGDLKGRVKRTRKNKLTYSKGLTTETGKTKPFKMEYDEKCKMNHLKTIQ